MGRDHQTPSRAAQFGQEKADQGSAFEIETSAALVGLERGQLFFGDADMAPLRSGL